MHDQNYILELRGITKKFPGVIALDDVSLRVKRGTVHAVIGENGAGKSTLMKIILGLYKPDSGEIYFQGQKVNFKEPNDALKMGIAMIHQEFSTVLELTVAENIFLGKEITFGKTPFVQRHEMIKRTKELFTELGMDIDPNIKMRNLTVAKQQLCEIAKAVSYRADLIIMDEPTSALSGYEVEQLFKIIRSLQEKGKTIIYITHKIEELFIITDEISVYRDGRYIKTLPTKETNRDELINLMVGRKVAQRTKKESKKIGAPILEVKNLSCKDIFENISFELRCGEILGVAGLMGAGRSEIAEAIFGIRKKNSGEIYINGQKVVIDSPSDAIKHKIAFLTEDRKRSGCFLPLSVRVNICIASIKKFCTLAFVRVSKTIEAANKLRESLQIKTPSLEQSVMFLSGGNQQKALLARWLLTESDILIIDEPTRGIDVGSKGEIHQLLHSLAEQGKAIMMISSEMPEILGVSDRIMAICEGKIIGFLETKDTNQEQLLLYCTGSTQ